MVFLDVFDLFFCVFFDDLLLELEDVIIDFIEVVIEFEDRIS